MLTDKHRHARHGIGPSLNVRRWAGTSRLLVFALFTVVVVVPTPGALHASNHVPTPPAPINPSPGQQTLLNLVNSLPINNINQVLTNFPVPYAIYATAGGADPVVVANKAGSPTRVDADRSKATGQGNSGHDLIVTVDTDLAPTPNLDLTVERLGAAPFADDLQLLVAFPFDAFNDEDEDPGGDAPNLFFGFHTTDSFDNGTKSYPPGGHAPDLIEFNLTPGTLAGTNHDLDLTIDTTDAANPIRYLAGHFNAPPGAEELEDALAMGLLADPVPDSIDLGLSVNASPIALGGPTTASVELDWEASAPTKAIFDYIENEDFPFSVADYGTTVTFNKMPTEETLALDVNFVTQVLTLHHSGNAPIAWLTVDHRRNDGLDARAVATKVPTEADIELDFTGSLEVDVNANTMDFALTAVQDGGFPGSDGLFGYPLGLLFVAATDVPDLTADWDAAEQTFNTSASNPNQAIGSIEFVMADAGDDIQSPDVQLPPDQTHLGTGVGKPWADGNRHVFSLIDDGERGTAAARLVQVSSATLKFSAPDVEDISEVFETDLAEPARPFTAFVEIEPGSALLSAAMQTTCNVHDFPHGVTEFTLELPPPAVGFDYETDPSQGIDEIFCFGFVDGVSFEVLAGDLPPVFGFNFDPAGSFDILAEDGAGGSQPAGVIGVRLRATTVPNGLGAGTAALLGDVLRDARFRADDIPSSSGTWSDSPTSTQVQFDTAEADVFLGGAQVAVSTDLAFKTPLHPPADHPHYLRFADAGPGGTKQLTAGAFGIDSFSYSSTEGGGNRVLQADYAADAARRLEVVFDSSFGGRFFPDFDIDATLVIDAVPAQWSLTTDLATVLDYAGSSDVGSILLDGVIDETNDQDDNGTVIEVVAEGLPAEVAYSLDPAGEAELDMSGPMSLLSLSMSSDNAIFGSDYRLVEGALEDIPAQWEADWKGGNFSLEARNEVGVPAPLGKLTARISSQSEEGKNEAKVLPFTQEGTGGCRINYSPFLQEIDQRYYDAGGATSVPERLHGVYCEGEALQTEPEVEDHLIVREADGSVDFVSAQFSGFQRLLLEPTSTGGVVELRTPTAGAHPFFLGLRAAGENTTVRIEDVPNEIDAELDSESGFTFQSSASAGKVDLYRGPLPTAGDGAEALRVTIDALPTVVEADWNLDPGDGDVSFTASSPFEVGLLRQDGTQRIAGALQLQNLSAEWEAFDFDSEPDSFTCIWPLIPFPRPHRVCGVTFRQYAEASLEFTAAPGLNGFLNAYDRIGNPQSLQDPPGGSDAAPDEDNGEYVPRFTFLLKDFQQVDASASIAQCLPGPPGSCVPAGVPPTCFPCDFDIGVNLEISPSLGAFVFDFWDRGEDPKAITGGPDYIDNSPWHILPLRHAFGHHFDPFD